jgi:regulatory protein
MKPFNTKQSGQKQIKPAGKVEDVTNYGVWLLGRRDRTVNEMRQKLSRKTDNPEWIEMAIKKLQEWDYLNEKRFVENFLKNCNEFKNYGPLRIKQEFRLKGADKDTVNSVMEEDDFDYFEAALQYLNKKYNQPVEDRKERDRITRYLSGRGFSFDMIRYAFEEHLKNTD